MSSIPRSEILKRMHALVQARKPIVGCGAGTGISAKFAEAGGADLIISITRGVTDGGAVHWRDAALW
jgi:predicted TIM-barrel enzyme